ncbi:P-loop containing nucleoside triphosphate hydrolase protein [Atractiella rhizophila]|nr:P-loop containing nucleoside triphosphate hydrolase protein [Atractiella rhizophila]
MAPKRSHEPSDESESEGVDSGPSASKRQRTRSALDNTPSTRLANAANPSSAGDDASEDDFEEDEDERARTQQGVNSMREQRAQRVGNVAQAGVIEKVELMNFMCHKLHTTTFKPQINFIIGHNGSGKSAVLTAITLALGGKASTTNRGTNLKGFIKEGETRAQISVTLKNQGSEAYEPEKYGKSITVERTIDKTGSGGYKIKAANGRIISTKKEELNRIMDAFGIQVDNPITVLSQDNSRMFLSNSSPKDKYNFFMRGTQLSQLEAEYALIKDNADSCAITLRQKQSALPELKRMLRESQEKLVEIELTKKSAERLEDLKKEKIWAAVANAEDDIQRAAVILEREKTKEGKYRTEIDKQKAALESFVAQLAEAERERDQFDNTTATLTEKEEIKKMSAEIKAELREIADQERRFAREYQELESTIQVVQDQIAEATRKNGNLAVQQAREQRIRDLETRRAEAANSIGDFKLKIQEIEGQQRTKGPEFQALRLSLEDAKRDVQNARMSLSQFERTRDNPLAAYGPDVIALCQAIDAERGWKVKPLGPIGRYVKLKDRRWLDVVETVLTSHLNAFVVQEEEDMRKLRAMMTRFKVHWCQVIKNRWDRSFDCSAGEPDQKYLTILRVLSFQHDHIRNVLVDGARIEATILVEDGREADEIMRYAPKNVLQCYDIDLYRRGGIEGGAQSIALEKYKYTPRLTEDIEAVLQGKRQQVERAIVMQNEAQMRHDQLNDSLTALNLQLQQTQRQLASVQDKNRRDGNELNMLQDELRQDQPEDIGHLQDQLQGLEADRANRDLQYKALVEKKTAASDRNIPLIRRKEAIDEMEAQRHTRIRAYDERTSAITNSKAVAEAHLQHYEKKLDEHSARIETLTAQFDELTAELGRKVEAAEMQCERPEKIRKQVEKIAREIENTEKIVRDRERRQGASAEQIQMEFDSRKKNLEEATKAVRDVEVFIKALSASLNNRLNRWLSFRFTIGRRAKMNFLYYLSMRGFSGSLSFDHDRQRLHLRIQTDDNNQTKGKDKDPKSLSGGEKSFSTIALLLCLWEAVGCPLRALDEFDVFQDAVNRRISMKMMVDTARLADETQFILITPQDMSTAALGPETHIVRMKDPGRSQGTLRFGNYN